MPLLSMLAVWQDACKRMNDAASPASLAGVHILSGPAVTITAPQSARMVFATLVVLLATSALVSAQYPTIPVVHVPGNLNFAVIGDWGRMGGVKSVTLASQGGFDITGYCNQYFGMDLEDSVPGAIAQQSTALVMERAIRNNNAKFVVNTGDNFYECGIDTPMRVISDWASVYQGRRTPATANLTWYHTIGNHDVPQNSVQYHLDFAKMEPRWYFPSRYYAVDYVSGSNVTMRIVYINTNPFVSSYSRSTNKYFRGGPEISTTATPAMLTAQLRWIEWALNTSTADWTIVVGHHPVVGAASTVYGFNTSGMPHTSFDLGMRTTTGIGAWATLLGLLRTYNVTAYFNGHDHVLTHAVDPVDPVTYKTQYVTTGAGSMTEAADSCGATRPFIKYSNSPTPNPDCTNAAGLPWPDGQNGFNIVKASKASFRVDFYSLPDYTKPAGVRTYAFSVMK
ncbi:Metallo-dependent phosphatase-like protein [Haematococcus lacustris]